MGSTSASKNGTGEGKRCKEENKEAFKQADSSDDFSFSNLNEFSAELLAAVRFKMKDKFLATLAKRPEVANILDNEGRSIMHYVASHAEGLEELLDLDAIKWDIKDKKGESLLHYAVSSNCPMSAFLLAKKTPEACLWRNNAGKNSMQLAHEKQYGEVLNALLLGCCSEDSNPNDTNLAALEAIQILLDFGAVPDTWAPNGRSALMLAASADSPRTIKLLLAKSADISLRDTLNRTALMFAAAAGGENSVAVLMEAGGQQALSAQCNKGLNALGYAEHAGVKKLIERKFEQLEKLAHENEIALLATLQEEAVKEAAKKHKKTHRGQRKKRKGKRESTAAEPGDGGAQADQILQEEWETSGNGLDAPERAGAKHCSTGALDMSEDMKREFAAVLDKSEAARVPNGKAPVALIHADSTDRVFQNSVRSGNLAVELTAWKDTPNDAGEEPGAGQATNKASIKPVLTEQTYDCWESRHEEHRDAEWQEVKKESRKDAKKDSKPERRAQFKAMTGLPARPTPPPPPPPPPPRTSQKDAGAQHKAVTESTLQQSEPPSKPFLPHSAGHQTGMHSSQASSSAPEKAVNPHQGPSAVCRPAAAADRADSACSWANVVVGKANVDSAMCNSLSSPELCEMEPDVTDVRCISLPDTDKPSFQPWSDGLWDRHPLEEVLTQANQSSTSERCQSEIKQLKRSNMALQSKLLEFEVSWSQHTDALRQIQQAHELELKQVRHQAGLQARAHESEAGNLQKQVSHLQLEVGKARQSAARLHAELLQLYAALPNICQNFNGLAACQTQTAAVRSALQSATSLRYDSAQYCTAAAAPSLLQPSMDAAQQGLTAQMAFRQLNLGGAGFQQPKAQTPRQAGPDSASSLHAAAVQLNAAHLEPEAMALLAEKGSQTTRDTRSPWTPPPTTSRTAPHNLMDSIWSVDHPSDQSSNALPDTKAIWDSMTGPHSQRV